MGDLRVDLDLSQDCDSPLWKKTRAAQLHVAYHSVRTRSSMGVSSLSRSCGMAKERFKQIMLRKKVLEGGGRCGDSGYSITNYFRGYLPQR